MSSANIVNGRDVALDLTLLRETKKSVKEALAQRTAALVAKYLATPSNSVVDLYPGSDPWELHSRSGALTFVRGTTEILTASESRPGSNDWILTYESPVAVLNWTDPDLLRDDRAIPENISSKGPD